MILNATREFFFREAWRYVLRAVPIVGDDGDDEDALDLCRVGGLPKLSFERGVLAEFHDAGVADDLEPCLVGIVHQEKSDPVVGGEVAGGDVLLVTGEVREGEGTAVEDVQKAFGAATMLDVRPTVFGDGT